MFLGLRPGTYRVTEAQPAGYLQGIDSVGTAGGSLAAADQFLVPLGLQVNGLNYNFGEQPAATGSVKKGQAASVGFWNNKNGQALIKAFNGGAGHQLADWLAATLPHVFGVYAGSNNLTGQGNALMRAWPFLLFQKPMPAVWPFWTEPEDVGCSPKLLLRPFTPMPSATENWPGADTLPPAVPTLSMPCR